MSVDWLIAHATQIFLVAAVGGVSFGVRATTQTVDKRRALIRARINGVRRYYASVRIRQELIRLLAQCLFLSAAILALSPGIPRHIRGALVIGCLVLAEYTEVANSALDQRSRHELLEELDKRGHVHDHGKDTH